jgi:hypothetical protein
MKKWEQIHREYTKWERLKMERDLTAYGEAGWELVSSCVIYDTYHLFFKREIG